MKTKILIADDHTIFREGLIAAISQYENLEVIAEASTGKEAIEKFRENKPEISIFDIEMPNSDGISALTEVKSMDESAKVIILSMHHNSNYINDAIKNDVDGYVLKTSNTEELIEAINSILNGEKYFSKEITNDIKKFEKNQSQDHLTKREKEIVKYIVQGLTYKEIADKLNISQFTVINHRQNIVQKLEIKNNADLIRYALSSRLVGLDS